MRRGRRQSHVRFAKLESSASSPVTHVSIRLDMCFDEIVCLPAARAVWSVPVGPTPKATPVTPSVAASSPTTTVETRDISPLWCHLGVSTSVGFVTAEATVVLP